MQPAGNAPECAGCSALRREVEELRKRIDAFQAWVDNFHKTKCSCGSVATHLERTAVGGLVFDKPQCDACSKAKAA
jgi:transcription elongation factor Elf1